MTDEVEDDSLDHLKKLKRSLIQAGVCPEAIESIEIEIIANDCPPGFLGKFKKRAREQMQKQFGHLKGELLEASDAISLLKKKFVKGKSLCEEETSKIKEQLSDLVKIFPAGLFAALNASLPIPGTSLLTPLFLAKMNLLPSRWRDAHVIEKIRKESRDLTEIGKVSEAQQFLKLSKTIEKQRMQVEEAGLNADLLSKWDVNRNGKWDKDEQIAYRAELKNVVKILRSKAMVKNWYVSLGRETWGPFRIGKIMDLAPELDEDLMVCWAGKSGWVDLQDLQEGKPQV